MSRKKLFKEDVVVSCRFDLECHRRLKDIASVETICSGVLVSTQDLIRFAVNSMYTDNERLRDAMINLRKYKREKWY